MKCALRVVVVVLVMVCAAPPLRGALVPLTSSATFNLYGQDYAGPNAGVLRNPDSSGPMPIAVFPGITYSAPLFDPSPASLTTAKGNATYASSGNAELLLAEGTIVQPPTARSVSQLRIDLAAGFVSVGQTPAHVSTLSYAALLNIDPVQNADDPPPFAIIDISLLYFVNGNLLPDPGVLLHLESGPTGGPVVRNLTGPDPTVSVPQLNDGDILAIAGVLTFTVNRGSIESVVPEPATLALFVAAAPLLSRRRRGAKMSQVEN